ncbi:hypothetical protein ACH5RR_037914 [Cinchona calisaya]|uniref:Uncharacterized protein n=1 Tax=Cinchona calisaya TaxID=153742 RepID=A0ABD2Y8R6_9GENT
MKKHQGNAEQVQQQQEFTWYRRKQPPLMNEVYSSSSLFSWLWRFGSKMRTERAEFDSVGCSFASADSFHARLEDFSYPYSVNNNSQFYTRILSLAAIGLTWDFEV